MPAEVLLDTEIHVHYGFLSLAPPDGQDDAARGQVNGLCSAACPGRLHLRTGPHTGTVRVRAELHDNESTPGDDWADAVEVIFGTDAEDLWPLPYCAGGDGELPPDSIAVDRIRRESPRLP